MVNDGRNRNGKRLGKRGEVRHVIQSPARAAEFGAQPRSSHAGIKFERERIRAKRIFESVVHPVRVGIRIRVRRIRRRQALRDLPGVGESVAIRVGGKRIRPRTELSKIRQPVAVGIARTVAIQSAEALEFPFVGQGVPVGRQSLGPNVRNRQAIDASARTGDRKLGHVSGRPAQDEIASDDHAVDIEFPSPRTIVQLRRAPRPLLGFCNCGPVCDD